MSMSAPPQILLREVIADGLDEATAEIAHREVRVWFDLAQRFNSSLRQSVEVTVHVTVDMPATIDRFNQDHGIPSAPYSRRRPEGASGGLVLMMPGGDAGLVRHAVIVDASLWSAQTDWHVVNRAYGLGYLIGHLLVGHDQNRAECKMPGFQGEYAECQWQTSLALCSAWENSIVAIDLCNASLRTLDGNPIQISDNLGAGGLQVVSEVLDQICIFSALDINFYRAFVMDLEDLYPTAMSLVFSLLRATCGVVSLFAADQRLEDLSRALSAMNGFAEFLKPIWNQVLNGCISETQEERVRAFSLAITELLNLVGLRIEDLEGGGLFVHVHEPVRCSWEEPVEEHS